PPRVPQLERFGRRPVLPTSAEGARLELFGDRAARAGAPGPRRGKPDHPPRDGIDPQLRQLLTSPFDALSKNGLIRSIGAGKTIVVAFVEPISSSVCR